MAQLVEQLLLSPEIRRSNPNIAIIIFHQYCIEELLRIWLNFKPIFVNFYVFGQIFIVVNGQILIKISTSHLVTMRPTPELAKAERIDSIATSVGRFH